MISVPIGEHAPLSFVDANGAPVLVGGAVFVVAPANVGSVSNSIFAALARGVATITATLLNGTTVSVSVLVTDPTPTLTLVVGTPG